jgi:hypothetical protein
LEGERAAAAAAAYSTQLNCCCSGRRKKVKRNEEEEFLEEGESDGGKVQSAVIQDAVAKHNKELKKVVGDMPSSRKGRDLKPSQGDEIVGTYSKREKPLELPSKKYIILVFLDKAVKSTRSSSDRNIWHAGGSGGASNSAAGLQQQQQHPGGQTREQLAQELGAISEKRRSLIPSSISPSLQQKTFIRSQTGSGSGSGSPKASLQHS